jgi:Trk K+ transport system NAD-binding subunit
MDIYESLCSPDFVLTEQIARQIFEVLPERGPIVVIIDREGNSRPSDPEEFAKLNISESFLKELCAKIDDGAEPVVTGADECSVIAAQLATEHSNCGYVIIALPQYSPESTLINIDLIEALLNQVSLIAKLIEKNNLLYEVQMKHYRVCGQSEIALN